MTSVDRNALANIIHVGTHEPTLTTRKTILERAGHAITLARDLRTVIAACENQTFDVAIIGQTLPPMEKMRVSDTLREKCQGIRILEFHDGLKPQLDNADAHLEVAGTTPQIFLETVERLARSPKKPGKAQET